MSESNDTRTDPHRQHSYPVHVTLDDRDGARCGAPLGSPQADLLHAGCPVLTWPRRIGGSGHALRELW
jgi:hypothetical protein